jgi:hypothetical protein
MKTLLASTFAVVLLAMIVAALDPGGTAGAVLALGAPFALFANLMALAEEPQVDASESSGRAALLVDWM